MPAASSGIYSILFGLELRFIASRKRNDISKMHSIAC